MKIRTLLDIPDCGIYALVNEDSRRIFLYYSNNILAHMVRQLQDIKYRRIRDKHLLRYRNNYRFEIIEKFDLPNNDIERLLQKLTIQDIEIRFHNLGYKVIKSFNVPKFNFFTTLESDGKLYLYLVNKQGNRLVVGVFNNRKEHDEYKEFLGSPKYIVCSNDLTKNYYICLKND